MPTIKRLEAHDGALGGEARDDRPRYLGLGIRPAWSSSTRMAEALACAYDSVRGQKRASLDLALLTAIHSATGRRFDKNLMAHSCKNAGMWCYWHWRSVPAEKIRSSKRAIQDRQALLARQGRQARPVQRGWRAIAEFASSMENVAKPALSPARTMNAYLALTRLPQEAPSLSRPSKKLPFGRNGRAFQSRSSLLAPKSDEDQGCVEERHGLARKRQAEVKTVIRVPEPSRFAYHSIVKARSRTTLPSAVMVYIAR